MASGRSGYAQQSKFTVWIVLSLCWWEVKNISLQLRVAVDASIRLKAAVQCLLLLPLGVFRVRV